MLRVRDDDEVRTAGFVVGFVADLYAVAAAAANAVTGGLGAGARRIGFPMIKGRVANCGLMTHLNLNLGSKILYEAHDDVEMGQESDGGSCERRQGDVIPWWLSPDRGIQG